MKNGRKVRQMNVQAAAFAVLLITFLANAENARAQWTSSSGQTTTTDTVGIGTTNPPRKFTVSNGGAEGLEIGPGNANGDASGEITYINYNRSSSGWIAARWYATQFRVSGVASDTFSMQVTNGGTTGHNFGLNVDAGSNSADQSFRVRPTGGGADYFAVRGDGNVGVGTGNAAAKLEVLGASYSLPATSGTTQTGLVTRLRDSRSSGDVVLDIGDAAGNNAMWLQSADMRSLAVNYSLLLNPNGGNVGVGATNPPRRFTVSNGGAEGLEIGPGNVNGDASGYVTYINYNRSTGAYIPAQWYAAQFRVGGALSDMFSLQVTNGGATGHNFGFNVDAGSTSADQSFRVRPSGGGADYLVVRGDGNVGIGTPSPGYKLDVNGNTNIQGNITASGNIAAKYQDVAEWVPSSEQLAAGTVVVLDATKSNQVISSTIGYDTRVAGVVSAQPGITLGEKSEGKVLVATTGRVRVKVDATKGPIHIGDLLVTSDIPGVAMKSEPVEFAGRKMHMPGTLIGKALEPLEKGKGEILVLLSLQ